MALTFATFASSREAGFLLMIKCEKEFTLRSLRAWREKDSLQVFFF